MAEDYDSIHHLRRDTHEAHTSSQIAKVLSTLALIGAIISLILSIWALSKAGDAQSTANRATQTIQTK